MGKIILIKYLNKKYSVKEFEEFVIWVKKETYKKDRRNLNFDHWKKFEPESNIHDKKKFSTLLDKIHHKINLFYLKIEVCKFIVFQGLQNGLAVQKHSVYTSGIKSLE